MLVVVFVLSYEVREHRINSKDQNGGDVLVNVTYCNRQKGPSVTRNLGYSFEQCNFRKIPPGSNANS